MLKMLIYSELYGVATGGTPTGPATCIISGNVTVQDISRVTVTNLTSIKANITGSDDISGDVSSYGFDADVQQQTTINPVTQCP